MACINKELKSFVNECFLRWSDDSIDNKGEIRLHFGTLLSIFQSEKRFDKATLKIIREKEISKKDFSLSLGGGYLYIHRYKKVKKEEEPKKDLKYPKGLNYEYYYKFYKPNYTKSTWTDYQ